MDDPFYIIKHPLLSEKGQALGAATNTYPFKVARHANKIQIKKAVEQLHGVTVLRVRTMNRHGKRRRFRFRFGSTPDTKKALVTLKEGDQIELL